MDKWLKKEGDFLSTSILAMFGVVFALNFTKLSVLGQPYNPWISICLLIFCLLFTIKNHFAELRLAEFYRDCDRTLKNSELSIDQILNELYFYIRYLLCLSIIHFYIFIFVFFIYVVLLMHFNHCSICDSKFIKKKYEFNPVKLYQSWFNIKVCEFIMICSVAFLIFWRVDFIFVAFLFITVLLILEIYLDWFIINKDFYIEYFVPE